MYVFLFAFALRTLAELTASARPFLISILTTDSAHPVLVVLVYYQVPV